MDLGKKRARKGRAEVFVHDAMEGGDVQPIHFDLGEPFERQRAPQFPEQRAFEPRATGKQDSDVLVL
jgi:hypothetical protein